MHGFDRPNEYPGELRLPMGKFPAAIRLIPDDRIVVTVITSQKLPERIDDARFISLNVSGRLFGLWQSNHGALYGEDFAFTEYCCFFGIMGDAFKINELPGTVGTAQVQFAQLREWIESLFSSDNTGSGGKTITVAPNWITNYQYGPHRLSFVAETSVKTHFDRVDANQKNLVRLSLDPAPSLIDLVSSLRSVQHLFDFIFANPVHFDPIEALVANGQRQAGRAAFLCTIFSPMRKRPGYSELVNLMNTATMRLLRSEFQRYASNWYSLWQTFGDPISVFYNSFYSDYVLDTQFMNVVAFLESYHKTFKGGSCALEQRILELLEAHHVELGFLRTPVDQDRKSVV